MSNIWMSANDEITWKEFFAAYFNALSMHFSRGTEKKARNFRIAALWTLIPFWYPYNTSALTQNTMEDCSS